MSCIQITYEGVEYTLGFSRNTISSMERSGFNIRAVDQAPLTTIETLFAGSFMLHHRFVKAEKIHEIYMHVERKEALLEKLVEMYNEAMNYLMDEPEATDTKKVDWKAI